MKRLLESEEAKIDLTHMERHYFGNFMEPDANIKIYDEVNHCNVDSTLLLTVSSDL